MPGMSFMYVHFHFERCFLQLLLTTFKKAKCFKKRFHKLKLAKDYRRDQATQ